MNFTAGAISLANFGLGILERYATTLLSRPDDAKAIMGKVDRVLIDSPDLRAQLFDPEFILVSGSDDRLAPAISLRTKASPNALNLVLGNAQLDPSVMDMKSLDSFSDPSPPSALRLNPPFPDATVHLHYFHEGQPRRRTFLPISRFDRMELPIDEGKTAQAIERLSGRAPWDGAAVLERGGTLLLEGDDRYVAAVAQRTPLPYEFLAVRSDG